jgi:hypothetical protein
MGLKIGLSWLHSTCFECDLFLFWRLLLRIAVYGRWKKGVLANMGIVAVAAFFFLYFFCGTCQPCLGAGGFRGFEKK